MSCAVRHAYSRRAIAVLAALIALLPTAVASADRAVARPGALKASVALNAVPSTTTTQAIGFLNQQRAANGIPGDLANDATMSAGCEEYANLYHPKAGQYPHEEVEGQPGYSEVGNQAASRSDLGGGVGEWDEAINPWSGAPLHIHALFDPAATSAWYGETHGRWGWAKLAWAPAATEPSPLRRSFRYPATVLRTSMSLNELASCRSLPGWPLAFPKGRRLVPTSCSGPRALKRPCSPRC
jgi:hypothetical protein